MRRQVALAFLALAVIVFTAGIWHLFRLSAKNQIAASKEITLVIYAPSSFVDSYGPGDDLKKLFEKQCGCTVIYVDVGTAKSAIDRLELDPAKHVDVVLGLNLLLLRGAALRVKFEQLRESPRTSAPELKDYHYQRFTPYDWSPMGFVYNKQNDANIGRIKGWGDAFKMFPEKSLALEDPALSTPGLAWLFWLYRSQNDMESSLKKLARLTYAVTPSWSASYGLFKNGQVKSTFSYLTSLVYHWRVEKDRRYEFLPFDEGQPLEVEFAAVPNACWSCDTGKNFIQFLTSPEAQKIIAEKNYMFPATAGVILSPEFTELPKVKLLSPEKLDDFAKEQPRLIEIWTHAQ